MKIFKEFAQEKMPTQAVHASTLLHLDNGEILAAWFGGTKEGMDDVDIWLSRKTKDGWTKPMHFCVEKDTAHWNPVLFQKNDGTICLYFKVGKKIIHWQTYVSYSYDMGATWSEPKQLVEGDKTGGRGPVKNKSIYLSNGDILAPASIEEGPWRPFVDISTDNGVTWEKSHLILPVDDEKTFMIQPTLWEVKPGEVSMLLRTNNNKIYRSDSKDWGRTWCEAYPINMPNNNSGIDVVKIEDGRLVLVCNPTTGDFGPRSPLSVYVSENGIDFSEVAKLEETEGEYSYPSIVADGNTVYISYSWKRENVAICTIEF
jgi:predicted neuraminidase